MVAVVVAKCNVTLRMAIVLWMAIEVLKSYRLSMYRKIPHASGFAFRLASGLRRRHEGCIVSTERESDEVTACRMD